MYKWTCRIPQCNEAVKLGGEKRGFSGQRDLVNGCVLCVVWQEDGEKWSLPESERYIFDAAMDSWTYGSENYGEEKTRQSSGGTYAVQKPADDP